MRLSPGFAVDSFRATKHRSVVNTEEETLLCSVLRGEPGSWPAEAGFQERFLAAGRRHGVQALLAHQLQQTPAGDDWPIALRQELSRIAANATARDLMRSRELARVLAALAEAGVEPLLIKGAALAYQIYPAPALRSRQDADLLVRESDLSATLGVLAACGYREAQKDRSVSGEPVSAHTQTNYIGRDRFGLVHSFDVHWRVSDTPLFTDLLGFDELSAQAVPLPPLGPRARGLGRVHALLLACLHRIHHAQEPDRGAGVPYYGSERLIWLYDIHRLSQALTAPQWAEFIDLAAQKRLGAVCRDGLIAARQALGTRLPEPALGFLSAPGTAEEIPLAWLAGSHGRRVLTDLRSLPGWRPRLALLRETLFPPAAYMLNRYRTRYRWLLPVLYLHRALSGVWKYSR